MNIEYVNDISGKLADIFKKRFNIDFLSFSNEYLNKDLLGQEIKMQPRDLVYLFFDIQNKFKIIIPQEFIAEGKFNSFNNIKGMIAGCHINSK